MSTMSNIGPDGDFDPIKNTFTDAFGVTISNVHHRDNCIGRGSCAIHEPSEHAMREFPIAIRRPGMFEIKPLHLERICPHGVGHPDPDDMVFWVSIHQESVGNHGCDGCCSPSEGEGDEQDS